MLRRKKRIHTDRQVDYLLNTLNSSKEFWSEINKHRRKNNVTNAIQPQDWVNHFSSVLNEGAQTEESTDDIEDHNVYYNEILDSDISTDEVSKAINKLKGNKAAGADGIVAELIKGAQPNILGYLVKLFNVLFSKGIFPTAWTKAILIPIHKKGSVDSTDNYRGISLLSVVSKVYTSILNNRLTTWVETNSILSDAQCGFRKGRSTIDHIFTLHAAIQKQFVNNAKLYVAFIDFRKAYDTVNRNVLWSVLIKSGIQGSGLSACWAGFETKNPG